MYMTLHTFLERCWEAKNISKKKMLYLSGGDIFGKEVCSRVISQQYLTKPKMLSADGREMGVLADNLRRFTMFEDVDSVVVRLHNAGAAPVHEGVLQWIKKKRIVFVDMGEDSMAGKPLYDKVKAEGLVVNCEELPEYSDELKTLVAGIFKSHGKEVTPEVIKEVILCTGNSIMLLSNLIALLCISDVALNPSTIARVAGVYRRDGVYELATSLGVKRSAKAFFSLNALMERGEDPRNILDRLAYLYSNIWGVLNLPKGDRVAPQVQSMLGVNSFEARQLAYMQKLYTPAKAKKICSLILNCYGWVVDKKYNPALALSVLLIDILEVG